MTDNAQLLIFVRYYDGSKKELMQDLLGVTTLKNVLKEKIFMHL